MNFLKQVKLLIGMRNERLKQVVKKSTQSKAIGKKAS